MPLDDHLPTEMTDTGVRFLSWGDNATRLYTGSSDGVVKVWDTARAQEDVFIKDLITTDSGIMSGSFSPDYSKLIIGEVNGSINILEVGKEDEKLKDIEKFKYIPYMEEDEDMTTQDNDAILGQVIAAELLATQQMITVPFGGYPVRQAVQGVNYSGPFDNSVDAPYLREQALQFQLNLATPSGGCEIHACKDNVVKITGEETGDSGRSKDRIPDELRQQWTMRSSNNKIFAGKSKCDRCGRPALLTETTAAVGEALFCERCSFACFRCGERNTVPPETETLHCGHCGRTWDIGALGYELISDTLRTAQGTDYSNVPWLRGYKKDIYLSKITKKDNATFGDEMNALTDHYHSLAICSPDPTLL
jgi:DNA-directed RNA polymerase subunit RPC12/RpoP